MKRDPRVLVAVALGLLAVVGTASHAAAQGWTLPTEPVTIGYWDTGNGTKGELIKTLIAEYQKLHSNVTIKFETDVKSDKIAVAVSAKVSARVNRSSRIRAVCTPPAPVVHHAAAWQ